MFEHPLQEDCQNKTKQFIIADCILTALILSFHFLGKPFDAVTLSPSSCIGIHVTLYTQRAVILQCV